MPDFLRARIITRDIKDFPHRDLEMTGLQTDLGLWWGDKPVPNGYVTVLELGEQKLDFEGGLDLSPHTPSNYETSIEASEAVDDYGTMPRPRTKRPRGHKSTRRQPAAKKKASKKPRPARRKVASG
ncbi:MAG: hypothetical protein KAI97_07520 [Gemmatimonadetes bacterium]|nr:hypothetical protein [Gemmatimonadota bacterium]